MADGEIGLAEAASMAVGGMVGGGIFAVLGVVAASASTLAWLAFVVAGVIAACAGYSFNRLNALTDEPSGPITFVQRFSGRSELAGMTGWTFVFGYVGAMAMYAYAFGGYFVELAGLGTPGGAPVRSIASVAMVAAFVGLNLAGARASGRAEDLLVALKVTILLVFGLGGLYYGLSRGAIGSGLSSFGVGPLVAAAVSFVAFEGWELLLFDQDSIRDPQTTVRRAVFLSIGIATLLYVLVAVVTTNLVSAQVIQEHAETALAVAAEPFLGRLGYVLISLAALFSTGSAINATLFSSARLAEQLVSEDLFPSALSGSHDEPVRALVVLGGLTAAFTFFGSLDGITSFASLAFITIFGGVSLLALRERDGVVSTVVPAVGTAGAVASVVALAWHLWSAERGVFGSVVLVAAAVIAVELLYFERGDVVDEVWWIEARF